jgi:ubiquinone/menaquinone biosynthesis C-methylase UbiE
MKTSLTYWVEGNSCCNQRWEDAYNRFESEGEEIQKFQKRLEYLGVKNWDREARIIDIFCGSGRNLVCLERMGFKNLHGVDLSPRLLSRYTGSAELYVGDATKLEFPDSWADIIVVQGGLHHLPNILALQKCLDEARRVLKNDGLLIAIEPWMSPFLHFVHWCCKQKLFTRLSPKLDALATMIEEEKDTYFSWLKNNQEISKVFFKRFEVKKLKVKNGKFYFAGLKNL